MTSELFKQIREILNSDTRREIIGIVGKPAAGKSTVVEQVASEFSPDLV